MFFHSDILGMILESTLCRDWKKFYVSRKDERMDSVSFMLRARCVSCFFRDVVTDVMLRYELLPLSVFQRQSEEDASAKKQPYPVLSAVFFTDRCEAISINATRVRLRPILNGEEEVGSDSDRKKSTDPWVSCPLDVLDGTVQTLCGKNPCGVLEVHIEKIRIDSDICEYLNTTIPNLRIVKLPYSIVSSESLAVLLSHPLLTEVDFTGVRGVTYSELVDAFGCSKRETVIDFVRCRDVVHRTTSLRFPGRVRCLEIGDRLGHYEPEEYFREDPHKFIVDTEDSKKIELRELDLQALRFRCPDGYVFSYNRLAEGLRIQCPELRHVSFACHEYSF
jgi:hypothetical protein